VRAGLAKRAWPDSETCFRSGKIQKISFPLRLCEPAGTKASRLRGAAIEFLWGGEETRLLKLASPHLRLLWHADRLGKRHFLGLASDLVRTSCRANRCGAARALFGTGAAAEGGEFQPYRAVLQTVVHGFGDRLGFAPTAAEASSLPQSLPHWRPFQDTARALRQLKTKYKLAVISNVDDDLFTASARQLEVSFDHVITSQQARAYKPSLNIFRLAQERIGTSPNRWLHVGQSLYHDVLPARSLGIATAWVNRPSPRPGSGAAKAADAQPDVEVPDLKTLAALVFGPRSQ
jgi:2-haloacid dehalogenase